MMNRPAILATATLYALGVLSWSAAATAAQKVEKDYPHKPIRVIVPSPAGGPPDLVMRMLLPYYSQSLGQPLVLDNRAGAGGVVGSATVAKGTPDGYTWLVTTASHTNTPPFSKNSPFDTVKDFSHISLLAQNFGQAVVVPTNSAAKSVPELIAIAKAKPGKMNYATAGIGTASHIPAEVMKSMAGVDIVAVQYKGVPEGMTDLIAGRMDVMFVGTQIALRLVLRRAQAFDQRADMALLAAQRIADAGNVCRCRRRIALRASLNSTAQRLQSEACSCQRLGDTVMQIAGDGAAGAGDQGLALKFGHGFSVQRGADLARDDLTQGDEVGAQPLDAGQYQQALPTGGVDRQRQAFDKA